MSAEPMVVTSDDARPARRLALLDTLNSPPRMVLIGMAAIYAWVFGSLAWRQTSNFGTFGYDMGIYDQGIWLATHFKDAFMTVRGLNFWGHHFNPIVFLFAPAYWLGAGPHFLVTVQTLVLAAGAIPVWLIAREHVDEWLALVPAGAYLLYPATQWIDWWHFHPDALMITPLLFAWWLARTRRWRWYVVALVVALACKEDAAVAITVMGVALVMMGEKKWGIRTVLIGLGWFLVVTRLIIPFFNDGAPPFYQEFFPGLGNSLPEILFNMIRHPSRVYEPAWMGDRQHYYWQLLAPVGGLPFLAPLAFLMAGPQVVVNVVSDHPTHDIRFHYNAVIIAAVFMATAEAFGRICKRGEGFKIAVVSLLVLTSVMTNHLWSPSPIGKLYNSGIWAASTPKHAVYKQAIKLVKRNDRVAATYMLVPALTHRTHIYEWPNPFHAANWGYADKNPPEPNDANVIVLDTTLNGPLQTLFDQLTGPDGWFKIVYERDGVVVARRYRLGPRGQMEVPPSPPDTLAPE